MSASVTAETFDDKCANYEVGDCVTDDGEVDIDVVAGIFYTRAKSLFREVFEEVLEAQRQQMIANGIPEDKVESCRVKMRIKQRKEVPAEERCQGVIKKTGLQCPNRRKEGYQWCGIHRKTAVKGGTGTVTGTTYEERSQGTYTPKEESDPPPRSPESVAEAKMEEFEYEDKIYLRVGHKLYFMPDDYDPDSKPNELDLTFAGNRRRDGGIEWL